MIFKDLFPPQILLYLILIAFSLILILEDTPLPHHFLTAAETRRSFVGADRRMWRLPNVPPYLGDSSGHH